MAHNIEQRNGVYSFVENAKQGRAWHKLGQVFDRPLTVREALENSHADYTVTAQPIVMLTPELQRIMEQGGDIPAALLQERIISDKVATMREDYNEYLGTVGAKYGIVQNADAFRFIDVLTSGAKKDTAVIETAGVLGRGERIFVTAKFPEVIRLDNQGDDIVEMNIVFTTSHNGDGAVKVLVTPTRVVCNNTLNYAMRNNSGMLYFKHTSGVNDRLDLMNKENAEHAYKTLNLYHIYKKSLEESFEQLRRIELTSKQVNDIVAKVMFSPASFDMYAKQGINGEDVSTRSKNLFAEVMTAVESGVGQDRGKRGTGLWLINGITTYHQNHTHYRSEERKMDSVLDGLAKQRLQTAYRSVLEVA